MAFEIIPDGHGFILSGELDMAHATEFADAFRDVLPAGRIAGPVTVDMRQLTFMDSSGIQVIVAAAKNAREACIVLHGLHDEVQKIVDVTQIDKALPNLHVMPCTVGVR
jgi:anti-sigma B factor antagonist